MLTSRGFTMIELMVVIAVAALLLMVGLPSYSIWTQNLRIRGATEAVQNGLQVARASAIARNSQVYLVFPTDNSLDYIVYSLVSPGNVPTDWRAPEPDRIDLIRRSNQADEGASAAVTMTPANTYMVTFGALGQVMANPDSARPNVIEIASAVSSDPAIRRLKVVISAGGSIKACDPAVTDTADPRICP